MPRTNHFSRHFLPPIAVPSSRVFLQCALGNSSFQPVKSMEKGCHKCKKRGKCFAVSENCRIFAPGYRNLAAEMAQLVEQRIRNAWVAGSSPAFGSLSKVRSLIGLRTFFDGFRLRLSKPLRFSLNNCGGRKVSTSYLINF